MSGYKFIVITSINPPSDGIRAFAKWPGWRVVVIGDRKTPANWASDGVDYIGIDRQQEMFGDFAKALPENAYARKMLGYVYAIRQGATAIFETDDDNLPYADAAAAVDQVIAGLYQPKPERRRGSGHWINSYRLFGAEDCWPRGLPIEYIDNIREKFNPVEQGLSNKSWAVMQFLCDDDPDVDAIYRITSGRRIFFARDRQFLFDEGTFSPINSQATLWLPPSYPAMFLPVGVSDRVTDILRGFIAQAALWQTGHVAGVSSPIGWQWRNVHDLRRDFADEVSMYINAGEWGRMLMEIYETSAHEVFYKALVKLAERGFVPPENLDLYESFLKSAGLK